MPHQFFTSVHTGRCSTKPSAASSLVARNMPDSAQRPALIVADQWQDYELLDTGNGMKQERWGPYNLVRPDPQIIWHRPDGAPWTGWDGYYHRSNTGGGKWEFKRPLPEYWKIKYKSLTLKI